MWKLIRPIAMDGRDVIAWTDTGVRWLAAIFCGFISLYTLGLFMCVLISLSSLHQGDCQLYAQITGDGEFYAADLKALGFPETCTPLMVSFSQADRAHTWRIIIIVLDIFVCLGIHIVGTLGTLLHDWELTMTFLSSWTIYFTISVLLNYLAYAFTADLSGIIPAAPVAMAATRGYGLAAYALVFWNVDRRDMILDRLVREAPNGAK